MLWVLAFHIIFVICWFAGLFYLPRLFVYHAESRDETSDARFKIMERKLFWGITTPSGILASLFGFWYLLNDWSAYQAAAWMHIKLTLVALLWVYHFFCLKYLIDFRENRNRHSHRFYRYFNEVPVLFLIAIVILAVVKP